MKYFLDTEFWDRDNKIDLISIGIVAEDNREYYAINANFPHDECKDLWIKKNVLSLLPEYTGIDEGYKSIYRIRQDIINFTLDDPTPEFYANYCSYDWVCFCKIFGGLMNLPDKYPYYCKDIAHITNMLGNPKLPKQNSIEHHSLHDARFNKEVYVFLKNYLKKISLGINI
jgi:hypothetical protein